jgi:cytochrome c oxidase subunit II
VRRNRVGVALGSVLAVAGFALFLTLGVPGIPGASPEGDASPNGNAIDSVYWFIFGFAAFFFLLIEAALVLFAIRYRRTKDLPPDVEGPQVHGNTRLELFWTIVPVLGLIAIAAFTFVKLPDVRAAGAASHSTDVLEVRVESHQFYWEYKYPNGAISLDTLRLPVDRPVRLELVTYDVQHSWWVPELDGKLDAIPGQTNVLAFTPTEKGVFDHGKCAELCGIQHAVMTTKVDVVSQGEFQRWVDAEGSQQQGADVALGKATFGAVCAKCHGFDGAGGVGPTIRGNGTLTNPTALRQLVLNGQDTSSFDYYMPPVGRGWPRRQFDALVAYIKQTKQLNTPPKAPGGANGSTG